MKTEIQETELYKQFIKALDINDMTADDNPFVVKCCEIAKQYSQNQNTVLELEIKQLKKSSHKLTKSLDEIMSKYESIENSQGTFYFEYDVTEKIAQEYASQFQQPHPQDSSSGEVEKLQAFKDYVHKRLDDAGIPTHPEGENSKHGCRIGDRLDIVIASWMKALVKEAEADTLPSSESLEQAAISIAIKHAKESPLDYTKVEDFQPHRWVVKAMLEFAQQQKPKGIVLPDEIFLENAKEALATTDRQKREYYYAGMAFILNEIRTRLSAANGVDLEDFVIWYTSKGFTVVNEKTHLKPGPDIFDLPTEISFIKVVGEYLTEQSQQQNKCK